MGFRKNRKASEIPANELKEIRRKERDYARRKKTGNVAGKIKKELSKKLKRPLNKQESLQIEMSERQNVFMQFFYRFSGNIAAACSATGIQRSTFNRWFKNCPELSEQIAEVSEAMLDLAEQQLLKNIAEGKEKSLFFLLCNKGKHRGWQDVRKLAAPPMRGIRINILHADNPKGLPVADTKLIESVEIKETENGDERTGS